MRSRHGWVGLKARRREGREEEEERVEDELARRGLFPCPFLRLTSGRSPEGGIFLFSLIREPQRSPISSRSQPSCSEREK